MNANEIKKIKQRFGIIGHAPALHHAIELAARVADTNIGILITGENGSGKESFANMIHHLSTRKHGHFVAVNCGAIPEGTMDSELFGHEKGAFTSASETRKGYFEASNDGSIFLDEIGEMPLHVQPRLLRVLENKAYMRVGSSQRRGSNARVIAATNVDLKQYVAQKKFREDLYYRIAQVEIAIPPLRERREDIHLLFRKFALDHAQTYQQPLIQLTPEAKEMLMQYAFPGNVRQLKNITWQLATLTPGPTITAEVLAPYLPKPVMLSHTTTASLQQGVGLPSEEREMLYKVIGDMQQQLQEIKKVLLHFIQHQPQYQRIIKAHPHLLRILVGNDASKPNSNEAEQTTPLALPAQTNDDVDTGENLSLKYHEARLIKKALQKGGNYREAAKMLGIAQRTLFRKVQKYRDMDKLGKKD